VLTPILGSVFLRLPLVHEAPVQSGCRQMARFANTALGRPQSKPPCSTDRRDARTVLEDQGGSIRIVRSEQAVIHVGVNEKPPKDLTAPIIPGVECSRCKPPRFQLGTIGTILRVQALDRRSNMPQPAHPGNG
jgi:hypothetical protein